MVDIDAIESFTSYKNGKAIEYTILLSFECEELKKHYVVYTDYSEDEDGDTKILVSSFDPELDELELKEVETEEEHQMIDQVLAETFKD